MATFKTELRFEFVIDADDSVDLITQSGILADMINLHIPCRLLSIKNRGEIK